LIQKIVALYEVKKLPDGIMGSTEAIKKRMDDK
jgi:hypothetical protein